MEPEPPGSPENLQIPPRAGRYHARFQGGLARPPPATAQRPAFSGQNQPLRADRKPGSWVSNPMSSYDRTEAQVRRVGTGWLRARSSTPTRSQGSSGPESLRAMPNPAPSTSPTSSILGHVSPPARGGPATNEAQEVNELVQSWQVTKPTANRSQDPCSLSPTPDSGPRAFACNGLMVKAQGGAGTQKD